MTTAKYTLLLATEEDAPRLAAICTSAFQKSDKAHHLIWSQAAPGIHDLAVTKGVYSPVQQENRVTYKAIDPTDSNKIIGFATWKLPNEIAVQQVGKGGDLPDLPGVKMELFRLKQGASERLVNRDYDGGRDFMLQMLFVDPNYHRQGIGSLLLKRGTAKADLERRRIWLMGTPQAVSTYEKNGWIVSEVVEVDLVPFGGEGVYERFSMIRLPV